MNDSTDTKAQHEQLAKYARCYAQNRTLPFLFQTAVFFGLCLINAGAGLALGGAFFWGNSLVIGCAVILVIAAVALTIWISVPRWGGQRLWRFGVSLYGSEGLASVKEPSQIKWPWWGYLLVPTILVCLFGQYFLTQEGWLAVRWAAPISLLYLAPFWIMMYRIQRPVVGSWMLAAPILATAYCVLLWAGLPLASDRFSMFWVNVYVPMFGAQTLAMVWGHFYSRYMLRKVKLLARLDNEGSDRE